MIAGRSSRIAALLAPLSFMAAAGLGGIGVEGFSHLRHPLALLGAHSLPHARAFGLFAFVVPGALAAWGAHGLRARLPRTGAWTAAVGARLALLAALAFAAQGLLPLDLERLDVGTGRYHATAWLLWALAFPAGAALLAVGLRRRQAWRGLAVASAAAALLVVVGAFLAGGWIGAALAQRLAFAAWLAWGVAAAMAGGGFSRGAA